MKVKRMKFNDLDLLFFFFSTFFCCCCCSLFLHPYSCRFCLPFQLCSAPKKKKNDNNNDKPFPVAQLFPCLLHAELLLFRIKAAESKVSSKAYPILPHFFLLLLLYSGCTTSRASLNEKCVGHLIRSLFFLNHAARTFTSSP